DPNVVRLDENQAVGRGRTRKRHREHRRDNYYRTEPLHVRRRARTRVEELAQLAPALCATRSVPARPRSETTSMMPWPALPPQQRSRYATTPTPLVARLLSHPARLGSRSAKPDKAA